MAMRTTIFKNTHGVTTAGFIYHVSSLLAQGGHTVLMVDADPQCNLTNLALQSYGESGIKEFYNREPTRNIYEGLSQIFKQCSSQISPIKCLPITRREDLFLLPGNVRIIEYEEHMKQCLDLQEKAHSAFTRAWALSNLIDMTAGDHNADLVLVDVGANTSMFKRDILMTSDYFMIMASPGLSGIAIDMIPSIFARWHSWYEESEVMTAAQSAEHLCIARLPKYLGMIIQEICPQNRIHEMSMQKGNEVISQKVKSHLIPTLTNLDMIIPYTGDEDTEGLYSILFADQLPEISKRISKMNRNGDALRG